MFGGPPTSKERAEDRDPIGDYKLTHDLALVGEKLFANPGRVVDLGMDCPRGDGKLLGRANQYTRSVAVWCSECTFRINR